MQKDVIKRDACRICGGKNLAHVLDLGHTPLANAFVKAGSNARERFFPLSVYVCEDCHLLQLLHVVRPEILFKNYDYLTSASAPLVRHFEKMADALFGRFVKSPNDLFVEIGGNDGSLLSRIKTKCRALNVDPASTVVDIAMKNGVETISKFFSKNLAEEILKKYGQARVVVANNVMAHVDDLHDIFNGVKNLIKDDGVFVFEAHWVGNLIGDGGFDQIYHEHLCYYSLISLTRLAEIIGLKIFDIETVPIHGESIRVYISKNMPTFSSVAAFIEREKSLGIDKTETFIKFRDKVEKNRQKLVELLDAIKKSGKIIAGYGAPAKGNTLLNFCGINTSLVDYIVDTTALKQGSYAPGSRIPVFHPDKLKEKKPDYMLLLAWNYADAILKKEAEYRKNGGKFIIPVPEPKII